MISITCLLVVATMQASIGKMVPKTAYFKMIDIYLLYSFNIIIIIMGIHTKIDININRDPTTGIAVDSRPSKRCIVPFMPKVGYEHLSIDSSFSINFAGSTTKVVPMDADVEKTNSRVSSALNILTGKKVRNALQSTY